MIDEKHICGDISRLPPFLIFVTVTFQFIEILLVELFPRMT